MLAIRRVLNSCVQADCDQSEINDGNKENSAVRERCLMLSELTEQVWII